MQENSPTAAIIIIGNEILSGRTEDKNINYIAKCLVELGIKLCEVIIIPDIEEDIIRNVNKLREKYSYIFTTGGIGPTHDDITCASIAKAFEVKLERNQEAEQILRDYYGEDINDARLTMACLPETASLIKNPISAAPGAKIDNVYIMAGIPNVMQAMFDSIKATLKTGDPVISLEIEIYQAESKIAGTLEAYQNANPSVEIGSYPFIKDNKIGVNVVLRSTDRSLLQKVYDDLSTELTKISF